MFQCFSISPFLHFSISPFLHLGRYDCQTGEPNISPSEFNDVVWGEATGHDWTCPLGWSVQGAHRPDVENVRVTSVAHRSGLAYGVVGDSTGCANVYKWPILPVAVLVGEKKKKAPTHRGGRGSRGSSAWKNTDPSEATVLMEQVLASRLPCRRLKGHHGAISGVGVLLCQGWTPR